MTALGVQVVGTFLDKNVSTGDDLQGHVEPESSKTVMKDIMELIFEPSGSDELNGKSGVPNPRVGMSSGTVKSSPPKPKIADSRVYSYDEMIERRERLNDSDEFEFDISPVEKDL